MREILFRGKIADEVSNRWVIGSLEIVPYNDGSKHYYISSRFDGDHMKRVGSFCVDPETVGQYTGLIDKNGKKIFEGDIVLYARDEEFGQIAYHESEAMFVVEFDTWITDFDHFYGKDLEVIGNIHDNTELLKGGAE